MPLRKGRLSRLAQLGGMAVGVGADLARTAVEDRFHQQAAQRLAGVLGEMKGLPLKMGQILSYIDDAIPPEQRHVYREVLGQLQAQAQHFPWEAMEAVLVAELGDEVEVLFEDFQREPIAAASIGQVYRATFEGRPVAVKVQYPGVAEALVADLANIESLTSAMMAILPSTDLRPMLEDATARLSEELDYEIEAASQELFGQWWAADARTRVPGVVGERSSRRVLTSEFVEARSWEQMLATSSREERCRFGMDIWRFVFGSLHHHRAFNADPHPGNYLFERDRVVFLDFGCVQRFDQETVDGMAAVRNAILGGVGERRLQELTAEHMGLEIAEGMWPLFSSYLRLTMEPVAGPQPFRFTRAYTERLMREAMEAKQSMMKKALRHGMPVMRRPGMVFMSRINVGLASILATLGAEADWRQEIERLGI